MGAANRHDLMVDNNLIEVEAVNFDSLKNLYLEWFANEENFDYIAPEFLEVSEKEADKLQEAAVALNKLAIKAAFHIAEHDLWKEAGIPKAAIKLMRYSLANELDIHLVGRYDFSGGMEDTPIKFLEFNADTCSLMPETAHIQELYANQAEEKLEGDLPFNDLLDSLVEKLTFIRKKYPEHNPSMLITAFGHEEDWLNAEIIAEAAEEAGFTEVQKLVMDKVIFSEEGVFVEMGHEHFVQFDFVFKVIPWEFIMHEEPELLGIFDKAIRNKEVIVLNPAYTALLQSKAILKYMYELEPDNPYLLKASFKEKDFPERKFVKKPIFGRMGENISMFDGGEKAFYKTKGDYGDYPRILQQLAVFNIDEDGCRYQPSIFWTGESSALCFRRQDDPVIDDDAEYVPHVIRHD